ncbi:hypothetical protein LINGRAHAP2_LOCUS29981 [Linum grandiflorum]
MKWFIDDERFPNSCLVSKQELKDLIKRIQGIEVSSTQLDLDLDDVQDETLLPESCMRRIRLIAFSRSRGI